MRPKLKMNADRSLGARLFDDRTLPTQMACAGLGAAAVAAALAWLLGPPAWATPLCVLGGGAIAALAGAWAARRTSRAVEQIVAATIALRRDDAPADANLPLIDNSADLRRATVNLRRLVEVMRERLQEQIARNVALGRRLADRTQQLTTLQDLSIGLATKSDLHELIDDALSALEQTVDYSSASVWTREGREARGQVALMGYRTTELADSVAAAGDLRGMRLSRANLLTYEQIERDRLAVVDNHARQSLLSWLWSKVTDDSRSTALHRTTRSWMALPLKFRDDVLGVLRVDHPEPDYFDAERSRLLSAVGSQAALAMRHARLMLQEREVAIIAERNRIARDLHDAVSQTLFAANVMAGTLARSAAREPMTDAGSVKEQAQAIEKLNRAALAEMRLLMFELRPDALEQTALAELLRHAIEALAGRGDSSVEQRLSGDDALPAPVRVQIYRIAQEALSNIARHSEATHVVVEWTVHAPLRATLRIADNGKGFDPDLPRPGHFGLDNMRSRASEIGATMTVTSAPGQATEVRVDLG